MNNGSSTGYFYLGRGTRQGDPISAYLFILALEILFIQIRDNNHIKGIMIDGQEIKLSAYADDGNFLITNVQSLNLIFNTCETFEHFSSLKLNLEKSEACWIGSARGKADKPTNCRWINLNTDKIRTLGVYNSYDTDLANKCNFFSIVDNIENCLNLWSSRDLALAGRIQIFNTLAFSKAVYVSTMINTPSQFISILNEIQQIFIWNKKRPKIKYSTLIGSYEEGGYKDVDIATQFNALKMIWLRRLLDNNCHPWKLIPTKLFSPLGGVTFFHSNLKLADSSLRIVKNLSPFYQELVNLWANISKQNPTTFSEICNRTLWNNSFITTLGKPIFYKDFIDKNMLRIADLLTDSGNFCPGKWQGKSII